MYAKQTCRFCVHRTKSLLRLAENETGKKGQTRTFKRKRTRDKVRKRVKEFVGVCVCVCCIKNEKNQPNEHQ